MKSLSIHSIAKPLVSLLVLSFCFVLFTLSTHARCEADEGYEAIMFYPGDLREDNEDILSRTRFDPIANTMITTSGEFEYGYYDVLGGTLITKYTGSSSTVYVPEMIDGMPVRGIGASLGIAYDIQSEYYGIEELLGDSYDYPFGKFSKPDFLNYSSNDYSPFANSNIVEVHIPDSVVSIGDSAFANCSELANIFLPDSVRNIGWGAFNNCTGLKSLSIPSSVIQIGGYAFEGCTALESVTISEGVRYIMYGAFKDCTKLSSIIIPNGITDILSGTFSGCKRLTSITIPDSVISVADNYGREDWGAFEGIPSFSAAYRGKTYSSSDDLYDAINGQ